MLRSIIKTSQVRRLTQDKERSRFGSGKPQSDLTSEEIENCNCSMCRFYGQRPDYIPTGALQYLARPRE